MTGQGSAHRPAGTSARAHGIAARERLRLAARVAGDALERVLYPRQTGTPQEHCDRIAELLGRTAKTAPQEAAVGREA